MVKDKEILQAIVKLTTTYAPTMREIGLLVGLSSTQSIHRRLKVLESKGMIINTDKARSISLTDKGKEFLRG